MRWKKWFTCFRKTEESDDEDDSYPLEETVSDQVNALRLKEKCKNDIEILQKRADNKIECACASKKNNEPQKAVEHMKEWRKIMLQIKEKQNNFQKLDLAIGQSEIVKEQKAAQKIISKLTDKIDTGKIIKLEDQINENNRRLEENHDAIQSLSYANGQKLMLPVNDDLHNNEDTSGDDDGELMAVLNNYMLKKSPNTNELPEPQKQKPKKITLKAPWTSQIQKQKQEKKPLLGTEEEEEEEEEVRPPKAAKMPAI